MLLTRSAGVEAKVGTPDLTAPRIAYLVSLYPGVSHTFILREVLALRARGFTIEVSSINEPDRAPVDMTDDERCEARSTFCVKRCGWRGALQAIAKSIALSLGSFVQAAWFAVRLAGFDLKRVALHLAYFAEAVLVAEWMKSRNLRHFHVHFATPAATVALILTRLRPVTFSLTVHGPDEFFDVSRYLLTEKIKLASFVCTIGNFARSQLMKLAPVEQWTKFELTPLGVDVDFFCPRPAPAGSAIPTILCVGRLVPAKGQHILLRAFHALLADGHRAQLCFVGDGPSRAALEAEASALGISDWVRFTGALNQIEIRTYFQAADIFVLPSFAEGIPVVLMEAMAMEIPCVSTWVNGIPELITHNQNGLLVPPSDVDALQQALAELLRDSKLRQRLGRAGREKVAAAYNLQQNVDRLAEVFRARLGREVP